MQPGENRWVQLTFEVPRGNEGNILPVIFNEIEGNNILNGFAIAAQPSPLPKVMRANLEFHSQVLARMAAIYDITEARQESLKAFQLSRNDNISSEVYRRFLGTGAETLQRYIRKATISAARNDPFDTERTFKLLSEHLRSQKTENVVPAHTTILHKVDALLTMHQKAKGDPADILQNVYWQKVLYATVPELKGMRAGRTVLDRSRTYIAGYESRRLGNDDYPELIRNLMDSFQSTAKTLASHDLQLEKDITEMHENLGSPAALQKAHRGFLVKLQSLRKELKKP
jgi:hypothetical protein